jgi:hypothetical protein
MANISHTTGNVGIGTSSPSTALHIAGLGNSTILTGLAAYGGLHFKQDPTEDAYVGFTTSAHGNQYSTPLTTQGGILIQGGNNYGTKIHFLTTDSFQSGMKQRMTLSAVGNLGIGTASPTAKLDVVGDTRATGNVTATEITVTGKASVQNIVTSEDPVFPQLNTATTGFRYAAGISFYGSGSYSTTPAGSTAPDYRVCYHRVGRMVFVTGILTVTVAKSNGSPLLLELPKPVTTHLFHSATPSTAAIGDPYLFDIDTNGTMTYRTTTPLSASAGGNWFSVNCVYCAADSEQ